MYHHEVELSVLEKDSWLYKRFHHDPVYFHIFNKSNLSCLLEVWLGSFVGVAGATIPKQQMWLPSVRARWLGIDQFLHFHGDTETRLRPTLSAKYLPSNSNLDCDRGGIRGLPGMLVTPLWEMYPSFSFQKEHQKIDKSKHKLNSQNSPLLNDDVSAPLYPIFLQRSSFESSLCWKFSLYQIVLVNGFYMGQHENVIGTSGELHHVTSPLPPLKNSTFAPTWSISGHLFWFDC